MSTRDSTSASDRTPFTVYAMHPPKGRHLHPFDRIRWRGFWRAGRHSERLGDGGCSAAHASWAAKDETSSPSGRRMGRGVASTEWCR
jgi:hypothetical protein